MAQKRKTVWVQHVAVEGRVLQTRLNVARATELTPAQQAAAAGVQEFIDRALLAADRKDPVPSRILNWWRGVLVEVAYRNVHAARAQLVDLYTDAEVDAEIPGATARAHATLHRDDPRCVSADELRALPLDRRRAWLRLLVADAYEAIDLKHAQLRSFRNILLMAATVIILLVAVTVVAVSRHPSVLPLCFPNEVAGARGSTVTENLNCPTRVGAARPTGGDIGVVALLGLLGGALAASIAIRNIRGTSTPYDVPVALAWLKVPLGAFTAVVGILAIRGGFVPGMSVLDNQEQILAYALLLGFAQQAFTGVLDRKAQSLLTDVPTKSAQPVHRAPLGAPRGVAPVTPPVTPPVPSPPPHT